MRATQRHRPPEPPGHLADNRQPVAAVRIARPPALVDDRVVAAAVLIVDDNARFRARARRWLEALGYGVVGFPSGVSGEELADRALRQARRLGAEILVTRTITGIDAAAQEVHLDGGDILRARTIILACGVIWRHLSIEGFERLAGNGISYGAARSDAASTHGLDIHIVGAANSAGQAAILFSNHARSVTILCRGEGLEKRMSRYADRRSWPRVRTSAY